MNLSKFRNYCAEKGFELTPKEANKLLAAYDSLKEAIAEAFAINPNFYKDICNKTVREKADDMRAISEQEGHKLSCKEYNELQKMIKLICEIEGYTSQ